MDEQYLRKEERGWKAERNKSIILLRLTPGAEPAAAGGGEAGRGGVRWMNTSSYYSESSERNKIKILLRLEWICDILSIEITQEVSYETIY